MQVSKLIEALQSLNPEEEVMALFWEKSTFDYPLDDEMTLTDKAWLEICDEFDNWDTAGDDIGQWIFSAVIEKADMK